MKHLKKLEEEVSTWPHISVHPHRFNSGWITFHVRSERDLKHALWLMRLSYLRYALKTASDARKLFEQESEALRLSPRFKSLIEKFVPSARQVLAEPLA